MQLSSKNNCGVISRDTISLSYQTVPVCSANAVHGSNDWLRNRSPRCVNEIKFIQITRHFDIWLLPNNKHTCMNSARSHLSTYISKNPGPLRYLQNN